MSLTELREHLSALVAERPTARVADEFQRHRNGDISGVAEVKTGGVPGIYALWVAERMIDTRAGFPVILTS